MLCVKSHFFTWFLYNSQSGINYKHLKLVEEKYTLIHYSCDSRLIFSRFIKCETSMWECEILLS